MLWVPFVLFLPSFALLPWLTRINDGGAVAPPFPVLVRSVVLRAPVASRYVSRPVRLPLWVVAVAGVLASLCGVLLGGGWLAVLVGFGVWVAVVAGYTDVTQLRIPRPVVVVGGGLVWAWLVGGAVGGRGWLLLVSVLVVVGYAGTRRFWSTAGGGDHNLVYALVPVFVSGCLVGPWWGLGVGVLAGLVLVPVLLVFAPGVREVRVSRFGDVPLVVSHVLASGWMRMWFFPGWRGVSVPAGPWIAAVAVVPALVAVVSR